MHAAREGWRHVRAWFTMIRMKRSYRVRRIALIVVSFIGLSWFVLENQSLWQLPTSDQAPVATGEVAHERSAVAALEGLAEKGRAPKTGYARAQFGNGWTSDQGCDMRNIILARDLTDVQVNDDCQVVSGQLRDPYTGEEVAFRRGAQTSQAVQIDHVVALSNAWQTGAQQINESQRVELANDPLNLLAVDGSANQAKSDGDAATWLPAHKPFRCQYVARQIAVKQKYSLWVVPAEKDAMARILAQCPGQLVPEGA